MQLPLNKYKRYIQNNICLGFAQYDMIMKSIKRLSKPFQNTIDIKSLDIK